MLDGLAEVHHAATVYRRQVENVDASCEISNLLDALFYDYVHLRTYLNMSKTCPGKVLQTLICPLISVNTHHFPSTSGHIDHFSPMSSNCPQL